MMHVSKLDINNFSTDIAKPNAKVLTQESIALAKDIAKIKNITFKSENTKDLLSEIATVFKEKFIIFYDFNYLIDDLTGNKTYISEGREIYNSLMERFAKYQDVIKQIKKSGYPALLETKKQKLQELFVKMLEYKNKKVPNNSSFTELFNQVLMHYNYYEFPLNNLWTAINNAYVIGPSDEVISVDHVDVVMLCDELYDLLTYEDDYKKYANFYKDFTLEDGMTLEDLYNAEKDKLACLFKEMLDYAGIKYDSTMTFSKLESLVSKYYPSYPYNMIDYACSNASMNYVKVYDTLEMIYENMAYSYKNKLKKEN